MSEDDDEYLWSGQGTGSEDVAAIERSLARLRWRPQPLVLPSSLVEAERARSNWWPAVAAGLVAAAAVLAVLLWPKLDSGSSNPDRAINPTAPPSSPDLKDPFGPRDSRGFTDPITDEPDPQVAPTPSPDLKDPFAGKDDPPAPPKPRPRSRNGESPDLKNPFGDSRSDPDPEPAPSGTSPDLKDPFSR